MPALTRSPTKPERADVLVVGGGIGGLAAALALARVGRRVHVLEAAHELGEIGAGIQLAPNATRMLQRLDLLEDLRPSCFFPRSLVAMDALTGRQIVSVDLGPGFVDRFGAPYVVTHRSDLHAALLQACLREREISLEVDKQVTRVTDLDDRALAHCADGTIYACDALIGADGLHSTVRRFITEDNLVASGYVAYRGTISVADAYLHDNPDSMVYWWGPGMHLVQYKVRAGALYNQVGVFRSDRFDPERDDWGTPEELDDRFGICCEPVKQGAALLERGARWVMVDREPIQTWVSNRVALLGDAAHPMLQYLAQGGCQALEDAVALADMVSTHDDVAEALVAYQQRRASRAARVQTTVRAFGDMIHVEGVGVALRNELLALRQPAVFDDLDWLYGAGAQASVEPMRSAI